MGLDLQETKMNFNELYMKINNFLDEISNLGISNGEKLVLFDIILALTTRKYEKLEPVVIKNLELNKPNFYENFGNVKITYSTGAAKTSVDGSKLIDFLISAKRIEDVKKTASFTQKSINELADGKELLDKYLVNNGFNKPSLKIGVISAEDKIKLEEQKQLEEQKKNAKVYQN